ncbi:hypothetical protein [Paraconexibacter sp.]|uniref:hypothetical protein n=1 Tax=Paraconexibacter sp. TaxID=2949640 RepID=UPI003565CD12
MSAHIPHPSERHPVLRMLSQFVLAIDIGFLALTAGIIVLAGFGVLESPVTLGIVIACIALWVVHAVRLHRHRADEHLEMIRARERRGF